VTPKVWAARGPVKAKPFADDLCGPIADPTVTELLERWSIWRLLVVEDVAADKPRLAWWA
jgi:hypothetical protein